jgi:diadenosine tetraphosphate (Ap4A) HIT family hydrolase
VAEELHSECPFCHPHDRAVLESHPLAIAIPDGFPLSQGHSLIVPRRHVASWFDLSNEEHGAIVELVDRLRRRLDATYAPDGYNLGINDGPAAGQTVMHVHMHVIPRYEGDMKDPRGGVRWVLPLKAAYWKRT